MSASTFSRRRLLTTAGAAALGLAAAPLLSACGSGTKGQVSVAGDTQLPSFVAATNVPTPDLPGTEQGVPAGYFNYPKPVRSVTDAPLAGDTLTALTLLFGAAPNPRENNPAWQAIEQRLGGKVDITAVADSDYAAKVNTTITGQLPDMIFDDGSAIKDIVPFLEAKIADLGPLIGGDKVKAYPNLAAIPQVFWADCVTNGKLYYLPIPRNITAGLGVVNTGLLKAKTGLSSTTEIRDLDDFEKVAAQLTDANKNQWAFGSSKFGLNTFSMLFAVPNQWGKDGDKLVRSFETPQYIEMLEFVAKLVKAGTFVPGSDGWTKSQMVNGFLSGKTTMIYDGMPSILKPNGYANQIKATNPDWVAEPILPFGKGVAYQDNINVGRVMLPKADDAKLKKVLAFANWLASPFGTEEYLLINYGIPERDYTLDAKGNPIATPNAALDTATPWRYLAAPPQVVYDTTGEAPVRTVHTAFTKEIPTALPNAVQGVYSPTQASIGSKIGQPITDAVQDFLAGRGSLDTVKANIKKWATDGGDKIRDEYAQGLTKK